MKDLLGVIHLLKRFGIYIYTGNQKRRYSFNAIGSKRSL